jgi:hypothetical protein
VNRNGILKVKNETAIESEAIKTAQRQVGAVMGLTLNAWFLPVVSGLACNWMEKKLVHRLLITLGKDDSKSNVNAIFWFIRKKMLLFNVATYAPFVGPALQLLEVYAIGQFTINCALSDGDNFAQEEAMQSNWPLIEEMMFSGEKVADSYSQFTGKPFPQLIRRQFVKTVDFLSLVYRSAERVPGVEVSQDYVGEKMKQVFGKGDEAYEWVRGKVANSRGLK